MSSESIDYRVTIHREDGSFWAEVAELPGCFVAGDSMEEIWEALPEAIAMYLSTPSSQVEVRIGERSLTGTSESVDAKVLVCH